MDLLLTLAENSGSIIDRLRAEGFREELTRHVARYEKGGKVPGRLIVGIGKKKIWFFIQHGPRPWDLKQTAEFWAKRQKDEALYYLNNNFLNLKP